MDLRTKMCLSKQVYKSKEQAFNVLKRAKKWGIMVSKNLQPYKCPFCSLFHLGHSKRRG